MHLFENILSKYLHPVDFIHFNLVTDYLIDAFFEGLLIYMLIKSVPATSQH